MDSFNNHSDTLIYVIALGLVWKGSGTLADAAFDKFGYPFLGGFVFLFIGLSILIYKGQDDRL